LTRRVGNPGGTVRTIKRYGNRKLYDQEWSRYVSLAEVAELVRIGHTIQVLDTQHQDITAQILAQIIVEEQKGRHTPLSSDLLHELIRSGGQAVSQSMARMQAGVGNLLKGSLDRLAPVRDAKKEMALLKERLAQLEDSLHQLEQNQRQSQGEKS